MRRMRRIKDNMRKSARSEAGHWGNEIPGQARDEGKQPGEGLKTIGR